MLGTTARGYNSSEYDYKLFNLTEVDPNLGGIGSITYNLTDFFGDLAPELTPAHMTLLTQQEELFHKNISQDLMLNYKIK